MDGVGAGVAILVRNVARFPGCEHLIDPGIQRRITGWSVDFLIVSTVMAIQLPVVWNYILPISVLSIVAGTMTTVVAIYLGKKLPQYNLERTAAVYAMLGSTTDRSMAQDFALQYMNDLYRLK